MPLDIAIVGAGICGLATAISLAQNGHSSTVYEASSDVSAVGAGIQSAPNMGRLLDRLGVSDEVAKYATYPARVYLNRWQTGQAVAVEDRVEARREFGFPYLQIHRAHLAKVLHDRALALGVEFRFNSEAEHYDFEEPSVSIVGGPKMTPDVLIVADGVKSKARQQFPQTHLDGPQQAQSMAFRALVDADKIKAVDQLTWLLEPQTHQHYWIGPKQSVVTYLVDNNRKLNMVFTAPRTDVRDESRYAAELRQLLVGWDPRLHQLLDLAGDNISKWPLWFAPHLDRTVSSSGYGVVLGDAAHDMSPYLTQGAAMSVEDACLLGSLFASVASRADVPGALREHEARRKPRTADLGRRAFANRRLWELPDGPEQMERDKAGVAAMKGGGIRGPYFWDDPAVTRWIYGHDVMEDRLVIPA